MQPSRRAGARSERRTRHGGSATVGPELRSGGTRWAWFGRPAGMAGGIDSWVALAFLGLIFIGALMVYSASVDDAYQYYGSPYYIIQREIVWVGVAIVALAVVIQVDYHRWRQIALPIFGLSVALLMAVLVPHLGHMSHGARRWFSLGGGATIEPSEVVKLTAIIYMAAWLTTKGERIKDLKATFVPFALVTGLIAALIVKQPDLGTTIVVTATLFALFFVAGGDLLHLALVATGASSVAWGLAHSSSYRFARLAAFTNPWKDPSGVGYHTVQALLALGSGGIAGAGLGNSVQKHVLPAPYTDSILAVIGEEWGLIGTGIVLALFMVIAYRGMRIAVSAPDSFGRLMAAGITCWITFQALLNFAVITSSVPFTGVPLPFISYGGTSLVITTVALGILLNISRHTSGQGFARRSTDNRRGNGRARVSGALNHALPADGRGLSPGGRNPRIRVRPTGGPGS